MSWGLLRCGSLVLLKEKMGNSCIKSGARNLRFCGLTTRWRCYGALVQRKKNLARVPNRTHIVRSVSNYADTELPIS